MFHVNREYECPLAKIKQDNGANIENKKEIKNYTINVDKLFLNNIFVLIDTEN